MPDLQTTAQTGPTIDVSELYQMLGYLTAESAALKKMVAGLQLENAMLRAGQAPPEDGE